MKLFLCYSSTNKSYRVYNCRTLVVEESMHVVFDESSPFYLKNEKENGIDVIFDGLIQNKNQNDTAIKDDQREDPSMMIKQLI
jgi:hypothetical protein